jgi:hypothetical protein
MISTSPASAAVDIATVIICGYETYRKHFENIRTNFKGRTWKWDFHRATLEQVIFIVPGCRIFDETKNVRNRQYKVDNDHDDNQSPSSALLTSFKRQILNIKSKVKTRRSSRCG